MGPVPPPMAPIAPLRCAEGVCVRFPPGPPPPLAPAPLQPAGEARAFGALRPQALFLAPPGQASAARRKRTAFPVPRFARASGAFRPHAKLNVSPRRMVRTK